MVSPKTEPESDLSDPVMAALNGATTNVQQIVTSMLGVECNPTMARMLAIFAVGGFVNAGGLEITQSQADAIVGMLAEIVGENGLSGFEH